MGIDGGFLNNVLVSKNSRNSYGDFYLQVQHSCVSVYCSEVGEVECWC